MEMPWFMWKGELSPDRGVTVGEYPPVARAGLRAERVRLPGRCGSLTLPGAAYDPVTVAMTVLVMPGTPPETVLAWLSGEGELILGNDPRSPCACGSCPAAGSAARPGSSASP